MRRTLITLFSTGIALASAGHAAASPHDDGCPSAFEAKTIAEWNLLGYLHAPGRADAVENGGNGDGITCGMEMPDGYLWGFFWKAGGVMPQVEVAQLFVDNDLPPADL
jgi:hypothetical protein